MENEKKPIPVCFLAHKFCSSKTTVPVGGAETQMYKLALKLSTKWGVKIHIITEKLPSTPLIEKINPKFIINRVRCTNIPKISSLLYLFFGFILFIKLYAKYSFKILKTNLVGIQLILACVIKRIFGIPIICQIAAESTFTSRELHYRYLIPFVKYSDYIQATTPFIHYYAKKTGIPESRIVDIEYGVEVKNDIELSNIPTNNVLCVGSLEPRKNVDFLIKSFKDVVKKISHLHLSIIGDGILRSKLEEIVKNLQLQNNVTFFGYRMDVNNFYRNSDILLFAGTREGLPNVLLEGMAQGLLIITVKTPITKWLLNDKKDSFLFSVKNTKELSTKILHAYENWSNTLNSRRNNHKKIIDKFSFDKVCHKFLKLYTDIIEKNK